MSEGLSGQLPFLLLMLVVFFFFIILPQQRRQKKEKNFMNSIKKGDRIITKSGVHAKIMELNDKDNTCIVSYFSRYEFQVKPTTREEII
jgi:preprotein translocase subunit YajC